MHKNSFNFLIFTTALLSSNAFAFINKSPTKEIVYCPKNIVCDKNELITCRIVGEISKYFNDGVWSYTGRAYAGTYHVTQADESDCAYGLETEQNLRLNVTFKYATNVVPAIYESPSWHGGAYPCTANSTQDCPFEVSKAFTLMTKVPGKIVGYARDRIIKQNDFYPNPIKYTLDDLTAVCGSVKQCKVDVVLLQPNQNEIVGSFIVDFADFKIKGIKTNTSYPYKLQRIEDFNSVEVVSKQTS